jgi:hypothetical protein
LPANRARASAISAPLSARTALFNPIIGQIKRAAGLAHDDKPQTRLDKLDAVLFAELLSLSNDGRYPTLDLAP